MARLEFEGGGIGSGTLGREVREDLDVKKRFISVVVVVVVDSEERGTGAEGGGRKRARLSFSWKPFSGGGREGPQPIVFLGGERQRCI